MLCWTLFEEKPSCDNSPFIMTRGSALSNNVRHRHMEEHGLRVISPMAPNHLLHGGSVCSTCGNGEIRFLLAGHEISHASRMVMRQPQAQCPGNDGRPALGSKDTVLSPR